MDLIVKKITRQVLWIGISSLTAISTFASECDLEYISHNNAVLEKIVSNDLFTENLGTAQRDCLAVELQKLRAGDSICPTFQKFRDEFLKLSPTIQIELGKQCTQHLLLSVK